jgi:DNA-binding MarR family transcriptional regulator
MVDKAPAHLRFDGSVWCNLDIALRSVDQYYRRIIRPLGLTVIEWYIMRALFDQDGQHASELARAVGRAATSFTPNLDKLQEKGLIERQADPNDRRAVRIYLTESGSKLKKRVVDSGKEIDNFVTGLFPAEKYHTFLEVLAALQTNLPE